MYPLCFFVSAFIIVVQNFQHHFPISSLDGLQVLNRKIRVKRNEWCVNSTVHVYFENTACLVVWWCHDVHSVTDGVENKLNNNFTFRRHKKKTYNDTEMSRRLWVWPVYCRIRVPLRESKRRTIPSSPAVKRRCGILGCQTILTTPAGCSKDCRSTWWTTSQKLIRPCRVPVTTRLIVASGQKDTASTEFSSSSFEDPGWQDNVVNNWNVNERNESHLLFEYEHILYLSRLGVVQLGCRVQRAGDNQCIVSVAINGRNGVGVRISTVHVLQYGFCF